VSAGASPFRELTSGIPRGDRRNASLRASRILQEQDTVLMENFGTSGTSDFARSAKSMWAFAHLLYGAAKRYRISVTRDNAIQKDRN